MSTNPIEEDPALKLFLGNLDSINKKHEFKGWRKSFLDLYENFLEESGTDLAAQRYRSYEKLTKALVSAIVAVKAHIDNGDLAREKSSVKGRQALSELSKLTASATDELDSLLPATAKQEKDYGYSRFNFASVLVRDSFAAFHRLSMCSESMTCLQVPLKGVASKQILEEFNRFGFKFQVFCDVISDLGLDNAMNKCHELILVDDEEKEFDRTGEMKLLAIFCGRRIIRKNENRFQPVATLDTPEPPKLTGKGSPRQKNSERSSTLGTQSNESIEKEASETDKTVKLKQASSSSKNSNSICGMLRPSMLRGMSFQDEEADGKDLLERAECDEGFKDAYAGQLNPDSPTDMNDEANNKQEEKPVATPVISRSRQLIDNLMAQPTFIGGLSTGSPETDLNEKCNAPFPPAVPSKEETPEEIETSEDLKNPKPCVRPTRMRGLSFSRLGKTAADNPTTVQMIEKGTSPPELHDEVNRKNSRDDGATVLSVTDSDPISGFPQPIAMRPDRVCGSSFVQTQPRKNPLSIRPTRFRGKSFLGKQPKNIGTAVSSIDSTGSLTDPNPNGGLSNLALRPNSLRGYSVVQKDYDASRFRDILDRANKHPTKPGLLEPKIDLNMSPDTGAALDNETSRILVKPSYRLDELLMDPRGKVIHNKKRDCCPSCGKFSDDKVSEKADKTNFHSLSTSPVNQQLSNEALNFS